MKIGIDLTPLQGPHRMRGIGSVLMNLINHLPIEAKKQHTFVFYLYDKDSYTDPLSLLNLEGVSYECRVIYSTKRYTAPNFLPRRLKYIYSLLNQLGSLRDVIFGDSRIQDLSGVERFLQVDQSQPLPSKRKTKSFLFVHDLIPYVLESDYLRGYSSARLNNASRKSALRQEYARRRWLKKIRLITRQASILLANSEHTKGDFIRYLKVSPEKIKTCLLGVEKRESAKANNVSFKELKSTSWGPIPRDVDLKDKNFLLYVGGADPRRKISELVAAFNNLKARGYDIKLALAGDTMLGASEVPNTELQNYFQNSSYMEDVHFLGFVNNSQRDWLYHNALAFVYPSVYEGFGLPILEAMQYGTPVITYRNSSIPEVAGEAALYVQDYQGILEITKKLLEQSEIGKNYSDCGKKRSKQFSWAQTSRQVFSVIGKG